MKMQATVMLLVLAAAADVQTAQVYKSVDKEGNVTYSEEPPPGVEAQPVAIETHPTQERRQEAEDVRLRMLQEGQEVDRQLAQQRQRREALHIELERAEQALVEARRRLDDGMEPLPGERVGTVSGKSRLREEYFARVERLKDAVKAAERQVQEAQDALAKSY